MGNQIKYLKPLALAGLVAASGYTVNAESIKGTLRFKTGVQVDAVQTQPMHFGDFMSSANDAGCILHAPADWADVISLSAGKLELNEDKFLLSGRFDSGTDYFDQCGTQSTAKIDLAAAKAKGNPNIKPGIFKISGTAGSNVVISMDVDSHDFLLFDPIAYGIQATPDHMTSLVVGDVVSGVQAFDNNDYSQVLELKGEGTVTQRVEGGASSGGAGYATLVVLGEISVTSDNAAFNETAQELGYTVHVMYK